MKKDVIVCIGTVGRPTFKKCYQHVMDLKKRDPRIRKVVVIRDQPSQAAWLNKMRGACKGYTWCLQVDEDMYVKSSSLNSLLSLSFEREAEGLRILNASGLLFDIFLKQNVGSLKLWRSSVIQKFEFEDTLGSDRNMFDKASRFGYKNVSTDEILGLHDSAPTIEIGRDKYYEYIKKMIKFNGKGAAENFIISMENKKLNKYIVKEAWKAYYENINS